MNVEKDDEGEEKERSKLETILEAGRDYKNRCVGRDFKNNLAKGDFKKCKKIR